MRTTAAVRFQSLRARHCVPGIPGINTAGRERVIMPVIRPPNLLFVFADQLRAQATGFGGDPNAHTPALDSLAGESVNLTHALSGHPVCCPFRASLLTGQYDTAHGVIINDVPISPGAVGFGDAFKDRGYSTAYVGKWHAHGSPGGKLERRSTFVPPEKRFGFDTYFKGFECSHNYHKSPYYDGNSAELQYWRGYDTFAQTDDMCNYLESRATEAEAETPFVAMLSWGTPHDPYNTAPPEYAALYPDGCALELRPNVPPEFVEQATKDLRGYYAHIAALDDCIAKLLATLDATGLASNTIVVFTSDHGDMIGCQGIRGKHVPWDESIRVPFVVRVPPSMPEGSVANGREVPLLIDAPDIMPTMLSLCGLPVPSTVQGRDFSQVILGEEPADPNMSTLLKVPVPYHLLRTQGITEFRGVRTLQHTYVRNIWGKWLLYDNEVDPYQQNNVLAKDGSSTPELMQLVNRLEVMLQEWLGKLGDEFEPGAVLLERAGLDHFWEANVPWGEWPTAFSQQPFLEPALAQQLGGQHPRDGPSEEILAAAGSPTARL